MEKNWRFKFVKKNYLFCFRTRFFVLCLAGVLGLTSLGLWQLHRFAYKKTLFFSYQQQRIASPLALSGVSTVLKLPPFLHIYAIGRYRSGLTMLVENRWYHDQVGYNVLTPFQVPGQQCLLLIDRGWIPKSSVNALKPVVQGIQRVEGLIKSTQEYQFILGDNIMQPQAKPLVMQTINLKAIERVTHACYYPFVLRLDATQPYGYIREWVITAVPYQRHLAYAVQWFLMALILGIAYFLASITSEGTHDNTPI